MEENISEEEFWEKYDKSEKKWKLLLARTLNASENPIWML